MPPDCSPCVRFRPRPGRLYRESSFHGNDMLLDGRLPDSLHHLFPGYRENRQIRISEPHTPGNFLYPASAASAEMVRAQRRMVYFLEFRHTGYACHGHHDGRSIAELKAPPRWKRHSQRKVRAGLRRRTNVAGNRATHIASRAKPTFTASHCPIPIATGT